jgi:hypothetical protein
LAVSKSSLPITAGAAVDIETNLLPRKQLLEWTTLKAAMRIRTNPRYNSTTTPTRPTFNGIITQFLVENFPRLDYQSNGCHSHTN